MIKSRALLQAVALTIASVAFGNVQGAKPPVKGNEPVVNALMSRALADAPGKEVMMLTVVYPPGGADPVHRHDAHGFIYVLEGSIVMGVKGAGERILVPGDTFYEGPADVHTVGRNASATRPAKFLVFLLKEQAKPAVIIDPQL